MKKILSSVVAALLLCPAAHAESTFGDGTRLYGYMESWTGVTGLYEIYPGGQELLWEDENYSDMFAPLTSGWKVDNKLCGYVVDVTFGMVFGVNYLEYDMATGQILTNEMCGDAYMNYATLNPNDRYIYGFGCDDMGDLAFMRASMDTPSEMEVVCSIEESENCYGVIYNTTGKYLVGMRGDGTLVRVGTDGTQTVLMNTGVSTLYGGEQFPPSAIAYSETENVYYWNPRLASYDDVLIRLDVEAKTATEITTFEPNEYKFMFADCERTSTAVPAAPEILSVNFTNGDLSGKVNIKMPSTTESGATLSGALTWTAYLDGAKYSSGASAAGQEVSVAFSSLAQGTHVFSFSATSGANESAEASRSAYVGFDTPAAPANVKLSATGLLSWDAVSTGAHGGYVDADAVSYIIYVNGEETDYTTATSYQMELPESNDLHAITGAVASFTYGMTSALTESNRIVVGKYMTTPMAIVPTQEQFYLCTTVDQEGDAEGWKFDAAAGCFDSGFSIDTPLDDWLILPQVYLEAGKLYYFSMQTSRKGISYRNEKLDVMIGSSASVSSMTEPIVEGLVPGDSFAYTNSAFSVPTTGVWYIGLHGCSDVNQYGILVKDILVDYDGVRAESPAAVTGLTADAGDNGRLEATVTFTLPVKTFGGKDIPSGTQLTVTVTGDTSETVTGRPGERKSVTVRTVQGENRITVTPYIETLNGERAWVDVFTGVHQPDEVADVKCTVNASMTAMTLTWTAPTEGIDGGYIDVNALTYTILAPEETMLGTVWNKIAEGLTECEYTFTASGSRLDYYELAVVAVNAAGTSPQGVQAGAVLGTPHSLPMNEDFAQVSSTSFVKYDPWVTYVPDSRYQTMWGVLPMSAISCVSEYSGNACVGQGMVRGALGQAGFPVFSTKGLTAVVVKVRVWTGSECADDITITGDTYGMTEPMAVGQVEYNDEWSILSVQLPAQLLDRDWVRLYLNASFPDGTAQWVIMSDYSIHQSASITEVESTDTPATVYDLQGRRVANPTRSLYIVNGRKVIL